MRAQPPERMLLQSLADEFADFAQGMIRGNPSLVLSLAGVPGGASSPKRKAAEGWFPFVAKEQRSCRLSSFSSPDGLTETPKRKMF